MRIHNGVFFYAKLSVALTSLILSISACATSQAPATQSNQAAAASAATDAQLSIPKAELPLAIRFTNKCPHSGQGTTESPALIAVLGYALAQTVVPATVNFFYDKAIDYLNERQLRMSASSTAFASKPFYMWDNAQSGFSRSFGCIVVIRGNFTKARPANYSNVPPSMRNDKNYAGRWNQGFLEKQFDDLNLSGPPELYAEFSITGIQVPTPLCKDNSTNTAPRKTPSKSKATKAVVAKTAPVKRESTSSQQPSGSTMTGTDESATPSPTMCHRPGESDKATVYLELKPETLDYYASGAKDNPSKRKNLIISLKMESVATKGAATIVARDYDFGSLEFGKTQEIGQISGDIFSLPAASPLANGLMDPVPVRVTAIITETEPGRDYSRAIAKALSDESAKKSITGPVSDEIVNMVKAKLGITTATTSSH